MKLFHKFLVALIIISLAPLILFSVILLTTTGSTLKKVIDQNNVNLAGNAAREVNKYFAEVETKLDIARRIERNKVMANDAKTGMILAEMTTSRMLLGLLLLDDRHTIISGMTASGDAYGLTLDKELLQMADQSTGVETAGIYYAEDGTPYFDVVYPLSRRPREYIYYRIKVDSLLSRLKALVKNEAGAKSAKNVLLIESTGGAASTTGEKINRADEEKLLALVSGPKNKVFKMYGKVNVALLTRGPGWMVILQEPLAAAYAPITRMWVISVILIMITLGAALFGAFALARNLSKPIEKLTAGMEVVANGNLDYTVESVSSDELGKLAKYFNQMIVRIKQMQEDVKKAERLSSIGQMANILGHEIRNPLAAITNAVYLIKRCVTQIPEVNPVLPKSVKIIEAEIRSTSRIIDNMLDFSRTRPPVLTEHDINEVVRDICESTKVVDKVKVELSLSASRPAMIDIEEMKQVIRNLVNNAVDAMAELEAGNLLLRVYDSTIVKGGQKIPSVCIDVADSGCGIPPDKVKKIFEPFFSTKSKGTGLGLAVVRKIVEERHSGVIEVRSVVGKGTTFTIRLPAKQ